MENPIKIDDLGGKPTIFGNIHIGWDLLLQNRHVILSVIPVGVGVWTDMMRNEKLPAV